jgi:Ni,Fe-hydrogenase III small subunit
LYTNAHVKANAFKGMLRFEGGCGIQGDLVLDVDERTGVVNEDAATDVHVFGFGLAPGGIIKTTASAANKVINGDALAWLEVPDR